jgi:hypothetical protein
MITTVQFKTLDDLYRFYNSALFNGKLADCIVNMSRHNGSYGFFAAQRWRPAENGENRRIHEISLNPDYLDRPSPEWHATFVHEMVHLWQEDCGRPSRAAYHNKEWAAKMEALGLIPSDTGKPGGKKTGQNVHHYINREGRFIRVFNRLNAETLEAPRLKYLPAYPHPEPKNRKRGETGWKTAPGGPQNETKTGNEHNEEDAAGKYNSKTKYCCPCGNNVWGKPTLNIICGACGGKFRET